jgi:hypothetical protein
MSREGEERECGLLSARDGLSLGCTWMETIGGFGRRVRDGVVVSVQWCGRGARARAVPTGRRTGSVDVQGFRVTAGRIRWSSMLARVARCWGFDAMQGDVQCTGKRCVHASERLCRSRRPERAREGTERGLGDGQWAAWAAASHWVSTTVARGLGWRGSRGWLDLCALVGTSMRGVASGFEREEW